MSGLCTLVFVSQTFAQDANELRQRAAKTNQQQVDRAYTNNLPNSGGGSGVSINYDAQKARELADKQQAEANKAAIEAQQYEELKRYTREREVAYGDARQKLYADTRELLWPALKDLAMNYKDVHNDDRMDWYGDMFFAKMEWAQMRTEYLSYPAARAANQQFIAQKQTATYEQLSEMLLNARMLPNTTLANLDELRARFPEKATESEVLELRLLPFYFGANRPYLHPRSYFEKDFYYPTTHFENESIAENDRIAKLERFIALAKKHPVQALLSAGYFRPHLNPFQLYVKLHPELDMETIENFYWMALYTKVPQPKIDYSVEVTFVETDRANSHRIHVPLTWLVINSDERLKTLTPSDWMELADQRLGVGLKRLGYSQIYVPKKPGSKETKTVKLNKLYKNFAAACKTKGIDLDSYY